MAAETELERMATGVYCILNSVNGKRYVGSSAECMRGRWADHVASLEAGNHHSQHLQRAWQFYGKKSFRFLILERCESSECVVREQFWIDHFQAADRNFGYNMSPTAGSQLGFKHGKESKAKIRAANLSRPRASYTLQALKVRGRKQSQEERRKRSASLQAAWAPGGARKNRNHSEETKRKISTFQKGRKRSREFCDKIRSVRTGWKLSEETKRKIGAANSIALRRITDEQVLEIQRRYTPRNPVDGANALAKEFNICVQYVLRLAKKAKEIA